MQKSTRLSLLGLVITILAFHAPSTLGGDMKPYRGWLMFPPSTGPDGASYSLRHDDIGGVGLRRAEGIQLPPVIDPVNRKVTLTILEEGVITYPDGSTITDTATIVLVIGLGENGLPNNLLYGGSADSAITGGTGRFEGASGWGHVILEGLFEEPFNLATGKPFRMPFEGMISTVGSLRQK